MEQQNTAACSSKICLRRQLDTASKAAGYCNIRQQDIPAQNSRILHHEAS
jgi:hypothetical protein